LLPKKGSLRSDWIDSEEVLLWGGQKFPFAILDTLGVSRRRSYIEYGFFPQSDFYYLDRNGVNNKRSLMSDDFSWLRDHHFDLLERTRRSFLSGFNRLSDRFIVVPLQVPSDSNVLFCSRFNAGMQQFIDYICDCYPEHEEIVFKAHPKDPYKATYKFHGRRVSEEPFLNLLSHARLVHGITSSTLYEAALAGIPVIPEGESLLNQHRSNTEGLLAAMVSRQMHVSQMDVQAYIEDNSNLQL